MNWFDADLMPLTEALGLLPGVQPQKARTFLYSLRDELADRSLILWKKDERAVATIEPLPGLVLTLGFTDDLFYGEEFGKQRITPRGAKLLMTLYEGGALPCRAVRGQIDAKLIAYSGSEDSLIAQVRAKREEARIATERRQGFIRDPSKLPEAEFTYAILNDIFFAHRGPTRGMATMKIGGIEVIKEVSGYAPVTAGRAAIATFVSPGSGATGSPALYRTRGAVTPLTGGMTQSVIGVSAAISPVHRVYKIASSPTADAYGRCSVLVHT